MSVAATPGPTSEFVPSEPAHRTAVARVEIFDDTSRALEAASGLAPASFYQGETFLRAWLETLGAQARAGPFFVLARDARGEAVALLPFGLFRLGPLRVAQFLGGKHSNYNLGLFRPGRPFSAEDLRGLLVAAAAAPDGPHLYRLTAIPSLWRGRMNPLAALPHRPAASHAYATELIADGEAFLAARLSPEARKKLRKKETRLAAMGPLRFFFAQGAEEIDRVLAAYFAHKSRLAAGHVPPGETEAIRAFYRALATGSDMELHALSLGDRIVAVFGAGLCGGRLQGQFISYDSDPDIARSSPGELLLRAVVRDACARGLTGFDLGVGEARYKALFCHEVESMVEVLFAPRVLGRLALPLFALATRVKAAIKRTPRLHALAKTARRSWPLSAE